MRTNAEVCLANAANTFGFGGLKISVRLLHMKDENRIIIPEGFKRSSVARDRWLGNLGCISELILQDTSIPTTS